MCSVLHCPAGLQVEQRIAKFSVVPTHRSVCHSQNLDPLLRGQTDQFVCPKMFLGRIVLELDGARGSVTFSTRGVD